MAELQHTKLLNAEDQQVVTESDLARKGNVAGQELKGKTGDLKSRLVVRKTKDIRSVVFCI